MSKLASNDIIIEDMEFLVKELHIEWERSGAVKAAVIIGIEEATEVNQALTAKIIKKQRLLENDALSFRESMALSKENFILYRLIKKIKTREENVNKSGLDREFAVPLDKEELKLFKTILESKRV